MAVNTDDTATLWLEGLAARGVSVTVRNNRLCLHPARAYKDLTDDEVLALRHHRAAIKDVVNAGTRFDVVQPVAPAAERTTPAPKPCQWCRRAPCIGREHHAFAVLHALDPEEQKRRDAEATAVMMAMVGRPLVGDVL